MKNSLKAAVAATLLVAATAVIAGCASKDSDKSSKQDAKNESSKAAVSEPEPLPQREYKDPSEYGKVIALTFDDGPSTTTSLVLDKLEEHGAVGTFFLIGDNITDDKTDTVRRAVSLGCEIENHSKTHSDMTKLSEDKIKEEIEYTSSKITEITGREPKFFRPPYISTNDTMYTAIEPTFICGYGCNDYDNKVEAETRVEKTIAQMFKRYKTTETSIFLDKLKDLGFKYSTYSGITIAASDVVVSKNKEAVIEKSNEEIKKVNKQFQRGLITDRERLELVIDIWTKAKEEIQDELQGYAKAYVDNPIFIMMNSKARGSISNFVQLAGMRGLMAKPNGETIEIPILSNFSEGLSVSEFFLSTHSARKGSADTALKTADSGYMTRRLVDVAQDIIVKEEDCGTIQGVVVSAFTDDKDGIIEPLYDRILGRYTNKKVINPETKEVIIDKNEYITETIADKIIKAGITEVEIRSVLTCKTDHGVCQKCYGRNLATGNIVEIGEAVGVMGAQSIGEPGTQLTMRTFHTGGVAGADITQGLPRVEELFEARMPKGKATISEISGTISKIEEAGGKFKVYVKNDTETREHTTLYGAKLRVEKGQKIEAGERLTEGSVSPKELLAVTDPNTVQQYILKEVQKVYRSQGVDINDKHVEIIARRMISKVRIVDSGDTLFLPSTTVSLQEFTKGNRDVIIQGKKPAIGQPILLGITKAALETDSFLSAASFQETTRILTEASVKGKVDKLQGLKENVIIGKLIPAGTGAKEYMDFGYSLEKEYLDEDASEVLEEEFLD